MSPPEEPRFSYLQGLLVLQLEAQHLSKASSLAGSQTLSGCALAGANEVTTTANRATKQILEFIHKDIPANAKKTCAPP
ncbi:hypothetical protein PC114_g13209 [Phytophthora cactorum]|uniref:Uncharacterized protein n=1 Tax=Phytophthora cactorum TaxID=29920 RepID=A0A8T1C2L5_9STRA|nr:hypothetical protein PC114_g13209 [Phytophthora cactorum]KAG2914625.1 hypothetical protein PC115_g11637 [Phytophthora cactorum]